MAVIYYQRHLGRGTILYDSEMIGMGVHRGVNYISVQVRDEFAPTPRWGTVMMEDMVILERILACLPEKIVLTIRSTVLITGKYVNIDTSIPVKLPPMAGVVIRPPGFGSICLECSNIIENDPWPKTHPFTNPRGNKFLESRRKRRI